MKSIIIYMSCTGNTRKIAKAIQRGMKPLTERCDLVTLKEAPAVNLAEYDLIGIGSPVWGAVPPIRPFMNSMPELKGKQAFVFCTHGVFPEYFYPSTANSLSRKGLTVIGYGDWYGGVILPPFPTPYLTDGHPDEIDLKEAEDFGKQMVEISRRITAGETQLIPPLPADPEFPKTQFAKPKPEYKQEKCSYPKCTLCMDNCPMGAIDLSTTPITFAKGCRQCNFCELICPTGAIEIDYEKDNKVFANIKEHYEHALDKPEASGKFRRLTPLDKIGWETPYYKVHDKHPRYVITDE